MVCLSAAKVSHWTVRSWHKLENSWHQRVSGEPGKVAFTATLGPSPPSILHCIFYQTQNETSWLEFVSTNMTVLHPALQFSSHLKKPWPNPKFQVYLFVLIFCRQLSRADLVLKFQIIRSERALTMIQVDTFIEQNKVDGPPLPCLNNWFTWIGRNRPQLKLCMYQLGLNSLDNKYLPPPQT